MSAPRPSLRLGEAHDGCQGQGASPAPGSRAPDPLTPAGRTKPFIPPTPLDSTHASCSDTLPISETFTSIQGEGKFAGVPSFFIRTSGCNLRCAWCDTPYASWNPEGRARNVEDLTHEAIAAGPRHAVLTGGEPMMFEALPALCAALRAAAIHITIETAGTIHRPLACDLMSISPKLSTSTPREGDPRDPAGAWRARHESRRINLPALQSLIDAHPHRQLKFVVCAPTDLPEIESLLSQLRNWSSDDILLMPEGVTTPTTETRRWLAAECLRRNWRYCPRLHIDLYGNRRGT